MRKENKVLQGTIVLTFGRVMGYALSFLRTIILARILAKADYGLAAIFAMAMVLLEVGGRMAFGQQVIQSKHGDSPEFQASAHSLQFVGGMCSALLIVLFSVPVAALFSQPEVAWALATLGVVPVCQGLSHLDIARRQRELDYFPLVAVDVLPQFLVTAAAWPLAVWLKDYRVIVWLIIAKAVFSLALSFVFARRQYRWAWETRYIQSMITFGWPLLINGLVMFGCLQADQMLMGAVFSLDVLAGYALAFSLVSIPWLVLGQVLSSLMLPLMSRAQDDPEYSRRRYRVCAQIAAVGGVVCLVPLIIGGEQLITLFYGHKYEGTGTFVVVLGSAAAVRFLRLAPAIAALAKADTINQLYSNLWRGLSVPLAVCVWIFGGSPVQIAVSALAGEVLATGVSFLRLRSHQGVSLRESYGAALYLIILVSLSSTYALALGPSIGLSWALVAMTGAFTIALGIAHIMFPEMSNIVTQTFRRDALNASEVPASQVGMA